LEITPDLRRILTGNGPWSRFFDSEVVYAAVYMVSWTVSGINGQFLCKCFVELGQNWVFLALGLSGWIGFNRRKTLPVVIS